MTHPCNKEDQIDAIDEKVGRIAEDTAYIRGQLNEVAHIENRVSSIEGTLRQQNVIGVLAAAALGWWAWFQGRG